MQRKSNPNKNPSIPSTPRPHGLISIPGHLEKTQLESIFTLVDSLCDELSELTAKPTAKHVHDSRVHLRRFFSIWPVLKDNGWKSKKFENKAVSKLRKLSKSLGLLRDWDVNLDLGKKFDCPEPIMSQWAEEHAVVKKGVRKRIKKLDIEALTIFIKKYSRKQLKSTKKSNKAADKDHLSTYKQLDFAVQQQEEAVKLLETTAQSLEELHELRLGIKRWRYLMTEFFGLTNLELVKAQQLLGKLNDYHRLELLIADAKMLGKKKVEITNRLTTEKSLLLDEFAQIRKSLPYGLRPLIISLPDKANNGSNE